MCDFPPEQFPYQLHSITDPQDRDSHFQEARITKGGVPLIDACRSPRKDDPLRSQRPNSFQSHLIGMNLTVNLALPYSSGNQLGVLRTEIENEDFIKTGISLHTFYILFKDWEEKEEKTISQWSARSLPVF